MSDIAQLMGLSVITSVQQCSFTVTVGPAPDYIQYATFTLPQAVVVAKSVLVLSGHTGSAGAISTGAMRLVLTSPTTVVGTISGPNTGDFITQNFQVVEFR